MALALVELVLWGAGVEPVFAREDPLVGFSALPVFQAEPARGVRVTHPRAVGHSFARQTFRLEKPANGRRIFTLGGSSARGFPFGVDRAFTRILGDALEARHPELFVEAVNAGAMSYASHRLLLLTREVLRYEPDLIVLYAGHNEYVERRAYQPLRERAERFGPLYGAAQHLRLFAVVRMLRASPRDSSAVESARRAGNLLGVAVVREPGVFDAAERPEVEQSYQENLRAILDHAEAAGVPVVLVTVASNLRDWRPHESLFESEVDSAARERFVVNVTEARSMLAEGNLDAAVSLLEEASASAPGHAEGHFELARLYEAQERWEQAGRAYQLARDLDAQPARAPGALNEIVRGLAREHDVPLVDVERIFEDEAEHGLVGFQWIEDYVHPTPAGHRRIARALFERISREGLLAPAEEPSEGAFAAAIERDAARAAGPRDPQQLAAMRYNTGYVLARQGHPERAIDAYRAALVLAPHYTAARQNLGVLLYESGRVDEARVEFERVLEEAPTHPRARVSFGWALLTLGEPAVSTFRVAVESDPEDPLAWHGLGSALHRETQLHDEAAQAFRRALELEPQHAGAVCNLGGVLLRADRVSEARTWLERCVALRPTDAESRAWLGSALQRRGDAVAAAAAYKTALSLDPGNAHAIRGLVQLEGRVPNAK